MKETELVNENFTAELRGARFRDTVHFWENPITTVIIQN